MSNTPVLSYKKPSTNTPSQPSSPIVSDSGSSSPKLPSVGATQGRNVLMRRKALQDFYKLQQSEKQAEKESVTPAEEAPKHPETGDEQINPNNPDEFNAYIKAHPIEDILRLRNSITGQLNSQDLAKKSIVYDNYYELIKLNQVLEGLSVSKGINKSSETPAPDALGIFSSKAKQNKVPEITDEYLDQVFDELSTFVTNEVDPFKKLFGDIVASFQEDNDTESAASIRAFSDNDRPSIPDSIDKSELSKEIHSLLASNKPSLSDGTKKAYLDSIQSILASLNHHKDELLILQLNDLKKMLV